MEVIDRLRQEQAVESTKSRRFKRRQEQLPNRPNADCRLIQRS